MGTAKRTAHTERMNALRAEAQMIVSTGRCPQCQAGLHRNLALHGWWQCDRFGAEGFRKDTTGESCSFQTFTQ